MNWIIERAPARKIPLYIFATLVAKIAYAIAVITIALHFKPHVVTQVAAKSVPTQGQHFTLTLISVMLIVIICEECLFRLPLASLIRRGWSLKQVLAVAIGSSVLFAYYHGGSFLFRLSMQGVGGLITSLLFIKCSGEHGEKLRALLAVIILHVLFDACTFAPSILWGNSDIRWKW